MSQHFHDPKQLEKEFRPWSNPQVILDNWMQKSRSYLKRANLMRDLPYGISNTERLDILKPSTSNAPVLMFIHGGYWQWLDKDYYAFALEPFVAAGALVITINYPLCPEVTLDTLVNRVRGACTWVWQHIHEYGGNPEDLHVSGHSAGGHLAAMMATTNWVEFQNDLPRDMIKSIVTVSGIFDLEPIRLTSINEGIGMDLEAAKRNSPIFKMPTTTLPVSIVVGSEETDELRRQSQELYAAWQGATDITEYIESPRHDHFSVIEAMAESNNLLTATILRHLELET